MLHPFAILPNNFSFSISEKQLRIKFKINFIIFYRSRFILSFKLFIITNTITINWTITIIYYFLRFDTSNTRWVKNISMLVKLIACLQGLWIFIIFTVKRNIYGSLLNLFKLSKIWPLFRRL